MTWAVSRCFSRSLSLYYRLLTLNPGANGRSEPANACSVVLANCLKSTFAVYSTTPSISLKHLHRHRMLESPDHFDRPLALMADPIHRPKKGERYRYVVPFLRPSCKNKNRITSLLMVNQVLAIGMILRCIGLRFQCISSRLMG
jgi:hypothetical protein